jgi:hypothetical protein
MKLNEYLTKIKQWWAGMVDRDVGRVIGEQPILVEQTPVEQPETTVKPVRVKRNKKSRPPAQPTKKPKTPRKKKETGDKKSGKAKAKKT